jgi:ribose transport system substrate-binding protein
MTKRKRGLFFSIVCTLLLIVPILSACSSEGDTSKQANSGDKKETIRIGFVMKTLSNPFFNAMEKGAQKASKELGIEIKVQAAKEETSFQEQIDIVENMITNKVDAIVIAPAGSIEIVPIVKKAMDAGIPVINVDNRIDEGAAKDAGLKTVPYVGASNLDGGYLAGQYLVKQLNGKGKVAVIEGIQGVDNAEQRKEGALKAFKENSSIEVVASQSANWETEQAVNITANILQANPDLKGIFAANDMMAFGAVKAIEAAGKTGKVLVTGYDALDQAIEYIKGGEMLSTVDQNPADMGYYSVKFALDAINGKDVPSEYLVDLVNITKENIK